MTAVLCAVDLSPTSGRVVYHAAGLAAVLGLRLKVVHIADFGATHEAERKLASLVEQAIPYEIPLTDSELLVRTGDPATEILFEASAPRVAIVVMGTRGLGRLARLVLGSTSEAVMRVAQKPMLLVPPTDVDIVTVASHSILNSGPVLAAVDLSHINESQLHLASRMADIAAQPLLLLSITASGADNRLTVRRLRAVAREARIHATAFIVRQGDVSEEISRCAGGEAAGLVVMGLNESTAGQAGAMAARVLHKRHAFVLVVPDQSISMMPHGLRSAGAPAMANVGSA